MPIGSVEFAVIAFPGNQFTGEIAPALQELIDTKIVRIIDIAIVMKDGAGNVTGLELSALHPEAARAFDALDYEVSGLLNEDDLMGVGGRLDPNSSAALLVWENAWSARFTDAVINAGGVLIANERIPAAVVKAALEYAESEAAV